MPQVHNRLYVRRRSSTGARTGPRPYSLVPAPDRGEDGASPLRISILLTMKICFVAHQTAALVAGGPLTQMRETARGLAGLGVTVGYFDQWRPMRAGEYDLVHLFNASVMTHDLALRLHQFGIPYVVSPIFFTLRTAEVMRASRYILRQMGRIATGVQTDYDAVGDICRMSRLVLPNTVAEGEIIVEGLDVDRGKIRVVPNGVDPRFTEATPELFEKEYGVRDFVLNVGHIGSGRKNVLSLMKAMRGIDRDLVVIGKIQNGAYADACLDEAQRNGRITIIDGLPNDSPLLASAYAASALFALPSLFETPGIAALEAALAGARIVITPHGGTREYFGEEAVYVEPASVESIAAGIRRSLAMPAPPELRERIVREYSWRRVAERTAEVYREAVDLL